MMIHTQSNEKLLHVCAMYTCEILPARLGALLDPNIDFFCCQQSPAAAHGKNQGIFCKMHFFEAALLLGEDLLVAERGGRLVKETFQQPSSMQAETHT